jgi:3-phytase
MRLLSVSLVLVVAMPHFVEAQTVVSVAPTVETDPVVGGGDAADDVAIWRNPSNPGLSVVIGSDKRSGLAVYDLEGNQLQFLRDGRMNNVDLRNDFSLDGERVDLVAATNQSDDTIALYRLDPATRSLSPVSSIATGLDVYGTCMYVSPLTGSFFVFVDSRAGLVEQWELIDAGTGSIGGALVRSFSVGSETEGCVADDETADLYIAEEAVGIWKYGAEPGDGATRSLVDGTVPGGNLTADVEGLTLYYGSDGLGYLIASSQGSSTYVLYERGGTNAHVGTFQIVDGNGIDGTSDTDGIDVTRAVLGGAFPQGLFVVQDGQNDVGHQNFKLVPWQTIAGAFSPPLLIDTGGSGTPLPALNGRGLWLLGALLVGATALATPQR